MERRKFSREFKLEAIKLVREREVSFAQAGRSSRKFINGRLHDCQIDLKHFLEALSWG